jgi:hypothetical protein
MKLFGVFTVSLLATVGSARYIESSIQKPLSGETLDELYLIETEPGVTKWVSEEEKWELRRVRMICKPTC